MATVDITIEFDMRLATPVARVVFFVCRWPCGGPLAAELATRVAKRLVRHRIGAGKWKRGLPGANSKAKERA